MMLKKHLSKRRVDYLDSISFSRRVDYVASHFHPYDNFARNPGSKQVLTFHFLRKDLR